MHPARLTGTLKQLPPERSMSLEENNLPQAQSREPQANAATSAPPADTASPSQPTSEPQSAAAAATENDEAMPVPKLKIGTQRPGSSRVKAKPQIESAAEPPPTVKKFPPPNKRQQLSP